MKLTRDLYIPFLDTSKGAGETRTYVPVDKSTIFELAFNPQEETYAYIDAANDSTEINSYQVELPQEITLESTNPMYKFIFELAMSLPTGSAATVPFLLAYPDDTGAVTKGLLWKDASISPQNLNTVDGKLSFNIKLNGDYTEGTVAISADAETGRKSATFTPTA